MLKHAVKLFAFFRSREGFLLVTVLVPGLVAIYIAHVHLPTVTRDETDLRDGVSPPSNSQVKASEVWVFHNLDGYRNLKIGHDGSAEVTGAANWQLPDFEATGGVPQVVTNDAGITAVTWEDEAGQNHLGTFAASRSSWSRVELPVFATALTAFGEDSFIVGGIDGRVRAFTVGSADIVEPDAETPALAGWVRFLEATQNGIEAVGFDGFRLTAEFDGTEFGVISVSDTPLPGMFPVVRSYGIQGPPRKSEAALQRFRECDACPELIAIPGGTFDMGSTSGAPEELPVRAVSIDAFALARTEVTVGEFTRFADATGFTAEGCFIINEAGIFDHVSTASWANPGFEQGAAHPAVCISSEDAQAYVDWLNMQVTDGAYRLPSEAEWEYAARANTTDAFYWGPDSKSSEQCRFANGADQSTLSEFPDFATANCDDGYVFTAPVGIFDANEFGLADMSGNVWEWTEDCWHESYTDAPLDGRAWLDASNGDCSRAVLRGGAWYFVPQFLRSAYRYRVQRGFRGSNVGFRVARTLPD